jgi:hypothetical protein
VGLIRSYLSARPGRGRSSKVGQATVPDPVWPARSDLDEHSARASICPAVGSCDGVAEKLITFCSGFYTVAVATERWAFSGRIAAFAVWISGANENRKKGPSRDSYGNLSVRVWASECRSYLH